MLADRLPGAYGVRYSGRGRLVKVAARRRRTRPVADARLTRERVVRAGLALLGRRGVERLSMRALADALGTAPMSLYRHVRSKEDLLDAVVALVLNRLDFDLPERGSWSDRAAAWMHSLRNQLRRSPEVVSILMQHGHYAPALLRATDTLLGILRAAGFEGRDAVRACREIMWSTLGFVSAEIRGPTFSPSFYVRSLRALARGKGGRLRPEEVAEVTAHMPHLRTRDLDQVFSAIVSHLLCGLAAELAGGAHEPRLAFIHADDLSWTEVIAQLHGERRVSVHEKFLEWTPERMVVLGRYDPHVVIERHGHASDHLVYVLEGELLVGERRCTPGTLIVLELGAKFGPLVAGAEGALLFEVWMGDPRPVPGDKAEYHALLQAKGIVRLPNPRFTKPATAPRHTDDGKDLYS
jgi:AcrR family transcriptional regulator